MGVIGAFDKGRSRNADVNLSIRRSALVLAAHNITLDLTYIESARNPADPLSRGLLGPASRRIDTIFPVPDDLRPYIYRV
jgi:hypothetical protein